ncbi:MAG: magnesium/cobalt transporter CorA [Campylobacterales bacterium]
MTRIYMSEGQQIHIHLLESLDETTVNTDHVLWIDMLSPTLEEIRWVEKNFEVEFPTKAESEEIEISSRFWEDSETITINAYFLIHEKENAYNETVTFILKDDFLITVRYKELRTFNELQRRLLATPRSFEDGYYVLSAILDLRIDIDADILEHVANEVSKLRRTIFIDGDVSEEILERIAYYEDLNMKIRENILDKQRILSSLLKSYKLPKGLREETTIMIKDINSLIDYTKFNFDRLDYLQNIFLGLLSVEQNKVIKIFTIVNVIFLPPTLIASIYGMNFDYLPELHWKYGYLWSYGLMILSAILPIAIFKKKGWI